MAQKVSPKLYAQYEKLDIHELEDELTKPLTDTKTARQRDIAVQHAIRARMEFLKGYATEFELKNYRHLLIFDSNNGYSKMIGNSLVLYSRTVAPRLNRKVKINYDTDDYYKSADGVISFKYSDVLVAQLAKLNIVSNEELSTPELHFFNLTNVYAPTDLANFRDEIAREANSVASKMLKGHTMPSVARAIAGMSLTSYHAARTLSEATANQAIASALMSAAQDICSAQIDYANQSNPELSLAILQSGIEAGRRLRDTLAFADYTQSIKQSTLGKLYDDQAVIMKGFINEYQKINRGIERAKQAKANK